MKDGFYLIANPAMLAGYLIEGGRVTRCSPNIRRCLAFWVTRGRRVASHAGEALAFAA